MALMRLESTAVKQGWDDVHAVCALASLRISLSAALGDDRADCLFGEIQEIVRRTLLAVHRVITQDRHCFELYGYDHCCQLLMLLRVPHARHVKSAGLGRYDVLVDQDLKPWLIGECAPSCAQSIAPENTDVAQTCKRN